MITWWNNLSDAMQNILSIIAMIIVVVEITLIGNYATILQNKQIFTRLEKKVNEKATAVCEEKNSIYTGNFYYLYSPKTRRTDSTRVIYWCTDKSLHEM